MNAIFENSPIEGTTTKDRTIYVNEAQMDNYPAIVTRSPTSPGRAGLFLKRRRLLCAFPAQRRLSCDDTYRMLQSVEAFG